MFSQIGELIFNNEAVAKTSDFTMGLEVEMQRVDEMHYLYKINNALRAALAPGELLWPLSMPPKLPADKSHLRLAKMGPKKEAYLKEWTKRHSYSEGTPCGVHIGNAMRSTH